MPPVTNNADYYEKVKAQRFTLKRLSDNYPLSLEKGMLMIQPGFEQEDQDVVDPDGTTVRANSFTRSEKPIVEAVFSAAALNPETSELIFGRRVASGNTVSQISIDLVLPAAPSGVNQTIVLPAVLAGKVGFGMAADVALASVKDAATGLSVALTRDASAGPPDLTADTLTFYQGANLALGFSPDLAGATVTLVAPLTAAVITTLTDTIIGTYSIYAEVISTTGRVGSFFAPQAQCGLNANFNPSEQSLTIQFRLNKPAGARRYYDFHWLNRTR